MPRQTPTSGYARIAQVEQEEEEEERYRDSEDDETARLNGTSESDGQFAPIQSRRRERMQAPGGSTPQYKRRRRANSGVDIKAINARLEKWAEEIAHKFKIRKITGKTAEEERLEIHHSVFQPPDGIRPVTDEALSAYPDSPTDKKLSKLEFDDIVESVRIAIEQGVQPKLISQGSSGSYFARTTDGKVVGVFKPKDEEPYANKNPKWTKWIHRNLFPFFFGRACLIPNLSYVSEAAAYVLDSRLRTNLVPYTDVVSLSSRAFFYDFWERRAYWRKGKPLPEKQGSFQVFLKGYRDANLFLKEHPWPDQAALKVRQKRRAWAQDCRPSRGDNDIDVEAEEGGPDVREENRRKHFWTDDLQQNFREQLERLVILDYIMRNTDRGLDNWMIRVDEQEANIVVEPPSRRSATPVGPDAATNGSADPYSRHEAMTMESASTTPQPTNKTISIGAIDNSLSWPWKHPDAWRSFPFGWLFLPVSLIGRPFSEATKQHFLPLLTSKHWWSDTQIALRQCFEKDADFSEKMFARQMAVMKGQAWNVVETLKTPDHGPLELTRRARVCVWDDIVEIPVATPMRPTSMEIRLKYGQPSKRTTRVQSEEMDIATALGSAPSAQPVDLLSMSADGPKNPFNHSRSQSHANASAFEEGASNGLAFDKQKERGKRPNLLAQRARMSMDDTRRLFDGLGDRRRRFSLSLARHNSLLDEEDVDGDLGFAAAEDQEHNMRKVIVERLETVKGKPPVFTWC